jgi:ribokinase
VKKVINFGSMNIDHVYQVDHLVNPGETLAAASYQVFPGGKGLNQSIALARAGTEVTHVGKIGQDGLWLKTYLDERGVHTTPVSVSSKATGHAMIQVSQTGENAIIIHGGANSDLDPNLITEAFTHASTGDFLLLQNETNAVAEIIQAGHAQGLTVVFNPAPMNKQALACPLDKIEWLIVNETEGEALTSKSGAPDILLDLKQRFPEGKIVLTLGAKGLLYIDANQQISLPAHEIESVDTTGTGDTFIGFFLAALVKGKGLETALEEASAAAAICATRQGAASSIPGLEEVQQFLRKV